MTETPRPWRPSWATIADHPCVTMKCSHCGCDLHDADEYGIPHFDSVAEALNEALSYGWTQDVDRLLCKECAGGIVCARDGHKWGDRHYGVEWTDSDGTVHPALEWWDCEVCEKSTDVDPGAAPTPGPDHPTLLDVPGAGEST